MAGNTSRLFQRAVEAHQRGDLRDAEKNYREILKSEPFHPSVNHNLGVLVKSANNPGEALRFFQAAVDASPDIERFWVSFLEALIDAKQFSRADQVLERAKKNGFASDKISMFQARLVPKIKSTADNDITPLEDQLNNLLAYYERGQLESAENLALSITKEFPKDSFGWKVLGVIFNETGRTSEALSANQAAVALNPEDAEAHNNLGNTFKELGKLDEAEESYKEAIALKPDYPIARNNLGVTLHQLGRLNQAEACHKEAIALKPDFAEARCNLGDTLRKLGRLDEAEASYKEAIGLKPGYAEAHNNLGIALKNQDKLDEAERSYKKAIALKPHDAEVHNNLGIALRDQSKLNEAEASYREAISLRPDFAEAHNNLGVTMQELGSVEEATEHYVRALEFKPSFDEAYINLGLVINEQKFSSLNRKLYLPLIQLLVTGNYTRPKDVARSILSLLKHDPIIKDLLPPKNIIWGASEITSVIKKLHKLELLHHLMRVCPLPDLQFDRLFATMRRTLLVHLDKLESSPELDYFFSTLSLHCFVNEYVFAESDEEIGLIIDLEEKIRESLMRSVEPKAKQIFCLACYRPLYKYHWCNRIETADHFQDVRKTQIEEPLFEKVIAQEIPVFREISDQVSRKVRDQYEENPYPRWVKLALPLKAETIDVICSKLNLQLHSEKIKNVNAPSILIAGCGTGQHSIETASRFSNCHVTAIDLSLASLAYAKRKSIELRLTNLDYLQADILHLHQLNKKFDIIESAGVLHHMHEPMAGWRVLTDLLKPGGLMRIGLYSDLARKHIAKVRNEIVSDRVGTSEAEIRRFRQSLTESYDENHQLLTTSDDFFSLSMLRDLIFHIQEHRFTLPQIASCLDELGLKFCGFEVESAVSHFRELHGTDANLYNLAIWQKVEEIRPRTFAGMYQFWCQKL